jgi:hypothetical protein
LGVADPVRRFVAYVALIWVTLPLLPPVVTWVRANAGSGPIALATPLAAGLLALLLGRLLLAGRCSRRARWTLPAAGLAGAGVLWWLRGNPVEQVHLLEYGLLGFLGLRAARDGGFPARWRLSFWGAAVPLAGLADELIQGLLPNRVFDWRDVAVNAVSGLLGMAVAASLPRFDPPRRGEV